MNLPLPADFSATHAFEVFEAAQFRVVNGVNLGDPIGPADAACLGDVFALRRTAKIISLDLCDKTFDASGACPAFTVSETSGIEVAGTPAWIAARLTFMTQIGASVDALVLVCEAPVRRCYFHPLGPIEPGVDYTLIDIEDCPHDIPLADLTSMSFGRGTRITRSDGAQVPVEDLKVGDRVLTRDNGMQPIRWVGKRTVQGVGAFAPVVISKGALGNAETMTVSQQHRMLISDWRAEVMVGARDVLIQASDLVNGDTIFVRSGGFVEYTQLIFDQHQILYAEGVPTESLHMSGALLTRLPAEVAAEVLALFPDIYTTEPAFSRVPLDSHDATSLLKQAGRL